MCIRPFRYIYRMTSFLNTSTVRVYTWCFELGDEIKCCMYKIGIELGGLISHIYIATNKRGNVRIT
jgi:hypothetical protein